jgi:hypothetical protein
VRALDRFERGQGIVWRSVAQRQREVHAVLTFTVVSDTPELVTLFIKPGWPTMRRTGIRGGGPRGRMLIKPDGGHEMKEWRENEALVLYRPGDAYSVWLYWGAADHDFRSWYINLEDPWQRTPIGFDSRDNLLDILVAPDLSSWEWKDEDELAWAVENGRYAPQEAATFRTQGERALERLRRREPPFDQDWLSWRPDQAWSPPVLPQGWKDYD